VWRYKTVGVTRRRAIIAGDKRRAIHEAAGPRDADVWRERERHPDVVNGSGDAVDPAWRVAFGIQLAVSDQRL
jgi:hypothetical protein